MLFSFSVSNPVETFSDRLLSVICLDFGKEDAEADADRTVEA